MDDAVGTRQLELDRADESRPACRLEVPDQKRCGQRWSAGRIDQPQSGTRRQFEAECRVQIPVGRGRPSPRGVFGQLAGRLLVKQPAADVAARLCIEQPDGGGIGGARLTSRGLGQLRLEKLRLEHAARDRVGPLELAGGSRQAAITTRRQDPYESRESSLPRRGRGP